MRRIVIKYLWKTCERLTVYRWLLDASWTRSRENFESIPWIFKIINISAAASVKGILLSTRCTSEFVLDISACHNYYFRRSTVGCLWLELCPRPNHEIRLTSGVISHSTKHLTTWKITHTHSSCTVQAFSCVFFLKKYCADLAAPACCAISIRRADL